DDDGAVGEIETGVGHRVLDKLSVVPAKAGTHNHRPGIWVPAFAGTTAERSETLRDTVSQKSSIPRLNVAEHHVDGLHLGVAQKLIDPLLAAEAGVLQATERRAVEVSGGAVDPDIAGLHCTRGAERSLEIVGEDRSCEAVFRRVGELQRFL